jgi:putative membrane protein
MQDGFLGYRTSFMLDFVVVSLVLIVPALLFSLWTVKFGRLFLVHKRLQLTLGIVLLVAVSAFEVDLHFVQKGWQNVVAKREVPLSEEQLGVVRGWLRFHLIFAISTPLMWAATIGLALKSFPSPPVPGKHSTVHKTLGWLSTLDVTMTAITGLIFYYFAFVKLY